MTPSWLETLPGWALALLQDSRVGRLGLIDDHDRPRVLPISYAVSDGLLFNAVDHKPKRTRELARIRFLRRNPAAALNVDLYHDEWSKLAWVQLLGEVDVLDVLPVDALDALVEKYAPYRRRPPTGPFLRFRVERALTWRAADGPGSS